MPAPKDPVRYAEWCKELSERCKRTFTGRPHTKEWIEKIKLVKEKRGYNVSEETRQRQREAWKHRSPISEETRCKMSLSHKGSKRSPETKAKMSESNYKRFSETPVSEETRKKQSIYRKTSPEFQRIFRDPEWIKAHSGENCVFWKGGISFEPYCPKFNNEFKERVRAFFHYECIECGTPQNGKKLGVHHINFDKMSCCNDTPPLFVPLCNSCHAKTNFNRPYWEQHFTAMIDDYYGGKCYFSQEEMKQIGG